MKWVALTFVIVGIAGLIASCNVNTDRAATDGSFIVQGLLGGGGAICIVIGIVILLTLLFIGL